MLCQNCNVNQATVFVHRIVNGQQKDFHLCSECAQQIDMQMSFEKLFQGFLDTFLTHDTKQNLNHQNYLMKQSVCSKCGFTYNDFKSTGKLGCNECYTIFHEDLLSILKNIQGSTQHNGKMPKKLKSGLSYQSQIINLQNELRKAVETEEYEQAAKIHDKIKKIKEEHNING